LGFNRFDPSLARLLRPLQSLSKVGEKKYRKVFNDSADFERLPGVLLRFYSFRHSRLSKLHFSPLQRLVGHLLQAASDKPFAETKSPRNALYGMSKRNPGANPRRIEAKLGVLQGQPRDYALARKSRRAEKSRTPPNRGINTHAVFVSGTTGLPPLPP
jgi:hypothetical protein